MYSTDIQLNKSSGGDILTRGEFANARRYHPCSSNFVQACTFQKHSDDHTAVQASRCGNKKTHRYASKTSRSEVVDKQAQGERSTQEGRRHQDRPDSGIEHRSSCKRRDCSTTRVSTIYDAVEGFELLTRSDTPSWTPTPKPGPFQSPIGSVRSWKVLSRQTGK